MRRIRTALLLSPALVAACAWNPGGPTLARLHDVEPDMQEVRVDDSLDQAMVAYREFLEEAPESALTPEAMRRLADLKLERDYGILGHGNAATREMPAPDPGEPSAAPEASGAGSAHSKEIADHPESDQDFERRASAADTIASSERSGAVTLPDGQAADTKGPLEAIALYDRILETYPHYPHNDQVLYQKARAFDELGRTEEAIAVIDRLIAEYPGSRYIDEVQFRRGEYYFMRRKYLDAEDSYSAVVRMGSGSEYYELALYKLGWTFYKQDLHEEALDQYIALLDYKVSTGYDFEQTEDEDSERRIADTFRVVSLSFSDLGGAEAVRDYFEAHGARSYEDKVYSHLGEFYLDKLRYQDAADSYNAFISLHPFHRASPHFAMRMVEIYEKGGFPKLVVESKKDFARNYGLHSEYWSHFPIEEAPEVVAYLKTNLESLANHYHALYQDEALADERQTNFSESFHWYREYLDSFPEEEETPGINYRLADLLLENENFGEAAMEYERTAYDYPEHEKAAAAGYAAIYAHREHEKHVEGAAFDEARRQAVESTLRFVDKFPTHEHAAVVLGAAVDDLYDMKEFEKAIENGHRLIDAYPDADQKVRRSAWMVVAHSSFETKKLPEAEEAYGRVLEMTAPDDESRQSVVDNLAASIYEQGAAANEAGDYRAAADHFLRISKVAPTSEIRPNAEYDAGAALMRLEDWEGAAKVFIAFRDAYPDHKLNHDATKQIAFIYRQKGDLSQAAGEYERVSSEADDPELKGEALLTAGELYEDSKVLDRAIAVYLEYVREFPAPVEPAVETRFKIAGLYEKTGDGARYREQLRKIVETDRNAGDERTDRVRYLAAKSALVLAEDLFQSFGEVTLVQPFERSLKEKQRRMNAVQSALGALVDYQVGEVTAAATYYMAEVYYGFSQSLQDSERPADLSPDELEEYEGMLEEQSYPFEEKAIAIHGKNLELMREGVYNAWIEKSLDRLATMMPGRYAKFEQGSGWIESVDTWAYRAPNAPDLMAEQGAPGEAPAAVAEPAVDPGAAEDAAAAPAEAERAEATPEEAEVVQDTPAEAETVRDEPAEAEVVQDTPAEAEAVRDEPAEAEVVQDTPAEAEAVRDEPAEADATEVAPAAPTEPADAEPGMALSSEEPAQAAPLAAPAPDPVSDGAPNQQTGE